MSKENPKFNPPPQPKPLTEREHFPPPPPKTTPPPPPTDDKKEK